MTPATGFGFRLDLGSGVPAYRQVIDQVLGAISAGTLRPGDQLPTVRQVAVDLSINPNTVSRAYKELEIRGILNTQQGTGTFIAPAQVQTDELDRRRRLSRLVAEIASKAGSEGFTLDEVIAALREQ